MSTHTSPSTAPALSTSDKSTKAGRSFRRLVAVLLAITAVLTVGYTGISIYMATQLLHKPQLPLTSTPASLGLQYKEVSFPSRVDHLQLRGWFIPGIWPNGQMTAQRTIIMVHGTWQNRTDPAAGLLDLSGDLARHGFAILAFDLRGSGESPPAPLSWGIYEQRDVLGAVDFLRSGTLPYPELGRPRFIAGWGVSLGAATLLMAAAQEPALRAIVSDSAYADILPSLELKIPEQGHLPPLFTPGGLVAVRVLSGIDYTHIRPVDVVANIAPRPIFFIQGSKDSWIPPSQLNTLAAAARSAPDAHVQTWLVPGTDHAQAYHTTGNVYVERVVAFYTAALGPDASLAQ
jgi:fermentation-respiration switch protein FrsA (DUF1100 family)